MALSSSGVWTRHFPEYFMQHFYTCVSTPRDVSLSVCDSSAVWCEDETEKELVSTQEVSFVLLYCADTV